MNPYICFKLKLATMKKLLFSLVFAAFALSSCSSEDEPVISTYTVKYEVQDFSGIEVSLVLFEYNTLGEKIKTEDLDNCRNGMVKKFTADKNAVKVKALLTMEAPSISESDTKWIQQVYYLNIGSNADIRILGTTRTGNYEP